jgi:hypothetical protein
MAVRIPIITVFDSKGLKAAQYQLNKVRGNFQNLGRNAAIAGAAVAAFGAVIVTSAKALSRIQTINAQTNAVLKSMGTTANGSAKDIENLAGRLEVLTATEAETIQQGANLLLTFGNIQNQVGKNNDIFDRAVAVSVDLARAMGTDASGEAIRLGKALNDPVKGIAALTRVGVSFTQQQKDQIKSLQESGDLLGAQKIILAELQAQFGGSGAAYAKTFAGQIDLLNHELGALGEEATLVVMPALQELVSAFRDIAPEAGEKLKTALGAVDWAAFSKTIADTVVFFVQNADAIFKTVVAIYALNTAYNLMKVTIGITNGIIAFTNVLLAGTTTAAGVATGALTVLRTALMLSGIGAVILALGFVVTGIMNGGTAATNAVPPLNNYGGALRKSGKDAEWAAGKYGVATTAAQNLAAAAANLPIPGRTAATSRPSRGGTRARPPAVSKPPVLPKVSSGIDKEAEKEKKILQKRKDAYKAFLESVKQTFGQIKDSILSSFNLPSLGNSVASITRNMRKLIDQTRNFSSNLGTLAGLGLDPALLQQIIQAGPVAGGALAEAIVAGGSSFVSELNAGYGEFGGIAGAIAGIGVGSQFGTQNVVNNYNIEVRGGLDSGPSIGRAIVRAIRDYERSSGAGRRA